MGCTAEGYVHGVIRKLSNSWSRFSPWLIIFQQYLNVGSTIYGIVIMVLKSGILLEWSKTFVPRGFRNSFWWTCHSVFAINVVFYVICTFLEIFGCQPREKLWNLSLPGKCIDITVLNIASASVNFVSDLVILLLPQKIIWGLHMSVSKKLGVAALFAVGLLQVSHLKFSIIY